MQEKLEKYMRNLGLSFFAYLYISAILNQLITIDRSFKKVIFNSLRFQIIKFSFWIIRLG